MKPLPKSELDSTRANRALLILAHRRLPEGFKWDYRDHEHCTIGLARYLGLIATQRYRDLAAAIGADPDDVEAICYYAAHFDQATADVTPVQIANRIERLP